MSETLHRTSHPFVSRRGGVRLVIRLSAAHGAVRAAAAFEAVGDDPRRRPRPAAAGRKAGGDACAKLVMTRAEACIDHVHVRTGAAIVSSVVDAVQSRAGVDSVEAPRNQGLHGLERGGSGETRAVVERHETIPLGVRHVLRAEKDKVELRLQPLVLSGAGSRSGDQHQGGRGHDDFHGDVSG